MSPATKIAFDGLMFAHPVLEAAVAALMYRRKLHRAFPAFFTYIAAQLATFCIQAPVYFWGPYRAYYYVFWVCAAVEVVLGFRVIHEIFVDVFRPYHALKDLGTVVFRWAGLVMLLVAGVIAASTPTGDSSPLVHATLTLQRCVRVVQCGLVLFLLVFSSYLGVSWRHHSFGISLGFGTFAIVELGLIALHASGVVNLAQTTPTLINMTAWNVSIALWFAFLWRPSPAREDRASLLKSQRWDRSLGELQNPATADSLIPMFETMVERALSKASSSGHEMADSDAEFADERMVLRKAASASAYDYVGLAAKRPYKK
jgi:hypothetical protein